MITNLDYDYWNFEQYKGLTPKKTLIKILCSKDDDLSSEEKWNKAKDFISMYESSYSKKEYEYLNELLDRWFKARQKVNEIIIILDQEENYTL